MRSDLARGFVAVLLLSLFALVFSSCRQVTPPVLTVSPTAHTVVEGGAPQAFTATLQNASDTISWSLDPDVGSIAPTTGATTTYTPPASVTAVTLVTLTATAGGLTAEVVITVEPAPPLDALPGEVDDPVEEAVPDVEFVPREEDYAEDHPELAGVGISFNTVVLVFELGTTVGEANELLQEIGAEIVGGIPGVLGEAEGILFLRVPTADHEAMIVLLEHLRENPLVKHVVQDAFLAPTRVSRPNGGTPAGWTWQTTPAGGNWGLERIRVPQLWNLNAAVAKSGRTTPTGVLDVGFANSHQDLVYDQNLTVGTQHEHGTHVAGTIAATFDNGVGVDGVNPFARLVVNAPAFSGSGTAVEVRTSWGQQMSAGYFGMINARSDVLVINASLSFNWYQNNINQNTNAAVHELVSNQGSIFALAQFIHVLLGRRLPLFVVAAGNDSSTFSDGAGGFVRMQARWSGPANYAGIVIGMPNIIVVESVADSAGSAGGATRSGFSNIGGDISAPGSGVLSTSWRSTVPTTGYETMSGTSMAAPHVTGLISYMYAVDPTLTHSQIVGLLAANSVAVAGGASRRIDAFATVMDIDRVKGGDAVLRMLLDIDDGTPDGNQRVLVGSPFVFFNEDADGDGGIGDGSIDMSDFRRWRDWLLQVENPAGLTLDGSADHPKKDVNGDGSVGTPAQENVFPRGDFNGDGQLSRTAIRYVPGRVNANATDLDVLRTLFSDPNYSASQLPGLINSADLEIWPADCLARPGVVSVASSIRVAGTTTPIQSRTHTLAGGPRQVYTAPVHASGYTARIEGRNAAGVTLFSAEQTFPMPLGSDTLWRADCDLAPVFTITSLELAPASPAKLPFSPEGAPCPSPGTVVVTGSYRKNVSDPVYIFARPYTQGLLTPNYGASGSAQLVDFAGSFTQSFCLRDDVTLERLVDEIQLTIDRLSPSEVLFERFVEVEYLFAQPEAQWLCIDFEDPPFELGAEYGDSVGDEPGDVVFTEQGVPVSVEEFTLGAFTGFVYAEVTEEGSLPGQSMWLNNVNLRFDLSALPFVVGKVTFDFEDFGGAENVSVNRDTIAEGELASGEFSGATLSVVRRNGIGEAVIEGTVREFLIGGQEFVLDNVCAFEAP